MSESRKYLSDQEVFTALCETNVRQHGIGNVRRLLDSCLAAAKKDWGVTQIAAHGCVGRLDRSNQHRPFYFHLHDAKCGNEAATLYIHEPEPQPLTDRERIERALAEFDKVGVGICVEARMAAILRGETR